MTTKRFLLCPGEVFSHKECKRIWVSSAELAKLYGLTLAECEVKQEHLDYDKRLPPLHPLGDGQYEKHLLDMKVHYFHQYIKARKLEVYNIERKRPELAKPNQRKAEWLAIPFPDFPQHFERLEKERGR